ncbi:hypothetical protein K493DRAFT_315878 [Basidiobolus meristosporus CBS 931.73]|uniref:Uncharacterized protein n=1 Tax=Basidiobolus meristosporus CBS 931.73 TaxID=1314790 RepID=A0A1Y1Y7E9_9FUNG|nr:hypothetical protein K493DRAFT_315878 [Basidiobolus meristosporus CBS 931.73]|eukprot:ORX93656.1 hypothetical protein K493DRAFT_315878 [Basidiobolus meristosporus CBS 931.73]
MAASKSLFEIFLLKDVLYKDNDLMNPVQLSVRGTILFQPSNTLRVRKITVQLLGNMSIQLPAVVKKTKRTLISKTITLVDNKKPALMLGKSIYHFEFVLPGDLPDSFDCEFGKAEYAVKAVAETSIFSPDLKAERPIYIRSSGSSYNDAEEACQVAKRFAGQIESTATLPINEFTPGEKFQLNIKAKHLALNGCITSVCCFVKEFVRYQIPSKTNPNEITVGEYLRRLEFSGATFTESQTEIDHSMIIKVPSVNVSYDCLNSLVEISHALSIRFHTNTETSQDQLTIDMPIMIVPTTGPTLYDQLPLYQPVEQPPNYQSVNPTDPAGQEEYMPPPNYMR